MKQGMTLVEMAAELQRQLETKKDYLADTRALTMADDTNVAIPVPFSAYMTQGGQPVQSMPLTRVAHTQVAQKLNIPQAYYDHMLKAAPDLLAVNVNRWFKQNPEPRMLRTLDGQVRAFLSHKYRSLDNYDLAEMALPAIQEVGCELKSCALTEVRMYIKAVTPRITTEVVPGDIVQAGIVISNSEVGHGSLKVEPLIFRLSCLNGMISEASLRRYHVGSKLGELEDFGVEELLTDETRKANDRAFWLKARDVIQGALSQIVFEKIVDRMREATKAPIERKPMETVEIVAKKYALTQDEGGGVLTHLLQGGDLSKYGLMNAVTRTSQDVESYERATELERLGGQIIELNQHEWEEIAS